MRRTIVLILLTAAACLAQTHPHRAKPAVAPAQAPPASTWPLLSVAVEGNKAYSEGQILAASGLRTGEMLSKQGFEDARGRLLATGYFRNVGYSYEPDAEGKGYRAKIQVEEEQELYPVAFDALPAADAELKAALKAKDPLFGPRVPATAPLVQRYVDTLTAFLAGKGYHEKIVGALAAESTPDLALLFHPAIRPSVAQVSFTGNKAISETELQNAIAGVAVGTVYIVPRFRAYLDNSVRPAYEAKGYVRVSFPKITSEKAPDVNGVIVHVQVEEGPVYKLTAVSAPEHPDLVRLAALKTGETVDFNKVKAAEDKIARSFRHQGYMHASATVDRQINDSDKTIRLVLNVVPGPRYKFRTLKIEGLDIVTEPVVRKMWGLKEGNPYNPDYPQHFLDVVKEEGIFDNLGKTEAQPKVNDEAGLVDVTLYFKGAPPPPKKKPDGSSDPQAPEPYPGGPPI